MILVMRCEKCNHLNGNINGEVVRSNVVCNCSCHDIPEIDVTDTEKGVTHFSKRESVTERK